ncbi:DNA gyrase/topoisomerase IV subunit A [Sphingobacterium oryzagri]|uniref:DNA gyrase/topoisomerase IV subunit A n=1 Tax=Sphingobacterium oryzagri TaxID=3025669 RepID=A0ABY7WCL8_9SPHI|nr:DNA gyrase/topoisomerase IV subunit A [Sphingobacterium sp. KACC 22765]WDF67396.1 DNA gyrase/topoisomerase IV subunit A [Sphingobacterium sp. KACC 22765]
MSEETNFSEENQDPHVQGQDHESNSTTIPLSGLYENWFLDYASYVILDRAVPHINDGFKPVQRRILHSLKEMDDGRYNKAANVIGNTMKYHPHGDASIGDAMVQIGQKDLLIDCQGNWGDPITGDSAAAPRYIEGRLSKFANEVVFNPDTTEWQLSYDGRNKEPVTLPVKFPLLLTQGAEGIAVGLATKIMPHNFIELIDGSIQVLQGERPNLFPDFPTGGQADVSNYNEGRRGGKIRVRATIEERDKKTLAITQIPFGTTTGGLIESVVTANEKGKIKIKKIEDNTAENVEIIVHLAPGISPDVTIDALYAFTACETSISPNTCVIIDNKPHFMSVNDILIANTNQTKELLKLELEIKLHELQEKIFFSSLLKIFIQEGMYKHSEYEHAGDFQTVVVVLNKLFTPFFSQFYREILPEDYKRLIDKPMSSITRFDVNKADEQMKALEDDIKVVRKNLKNLTEYSIDWFEHLRSKYSKGRERKTEIRIFDKVEAAQVALANAKLYVNREEGFIGTGMRKDEFVSECSDIDDIIVFRNDGKYSVTKVQDKVFVGKGIIHIAVFKKGDERTIYNAVYSDGATGTSYVKRFAVTGVTRDKEYDISKGSKGSKLLYFTANPNGEAEVINIQLKPHSKLRKLTFDQDFAEIAIKGRASQGNIVSKYPIKKITFKNAGVSTLAGRKIWFDEVLRRLNADERGRFLGEFDGDDKILLVYPDGSYEYASFDLSNHFETNILRMEKYTPEHVYTAIHQDGKTGTYFVKRFKFDDQPVGKRISFINDAPGSKLILVTNGSDPIVKVNLLKGKTQTPETLEQPLNEIIDIKGLKAQGNRLSFHTVKDVKLLTEEVDLAVRPVSETPEPAVAPEGESTSTNDASTSTANDDQKTNNDIGLEITNPDDVQLKNDDDDNDSKSEEDGQTSLF